MAENKVVIREFDEDRDVKVVGKLERNCEIGTTKKGFSIFTNMITDPLSRIRFYPIRIMLVAELVECRELVGVVRGCIKSVQTSSGSLFKMGCMLGLRVSPASRRKGVGLKLVTSIEEWMLRNGADYAFLATEKNNTASKNLFTNKCNYVNLSSLIIFLHPITFPITNHISSKNIKIEKINIDQAISIYTRILKTKDLYPLDMDIILKEKLSLGTWVSYYKDQDFKLHNSTEDILTDKITTNSSWIIFSLWNTCETDDNNNSNNKVRDVKTKLSQPLRFLHATLNHAKDKICPCLRMLRNESIMCNSFGFLFLYGLHGEGDNLEGLMESVWRFTSSIGEKLKECRVVITELGFDDPLVNHVPQIDSMTCVDDMWYAKRLGNHGDDEVVEVMKKQLGNVFVDPRDF
ncbi:unnamed protein product [Vicia faba]|uniref:N-acetyltransferase domain-containing protein n=1 Tax=Vicia faba TaxID=3906 RepID=A0AAV1AM31_VICFA|nr:unnamed protein product [Vicia faba]